MAQKDQDDEYKDQASYPDPYQKRDDGFFSPRFNEPQLPQDYETPASPPSDIKEKYPSDFPETDDKLEESEVYDEGISSATDADAQAEGHTERIERLKLNPEDEDEGTHK